MKEFDFAERDLVAAHKVEPSNRYSFNCNRYLKEKSLFDPAQGGERGSWSSEAEEEEGASFYASKNEQNV